MKQLQKEVTLDDVDSLMADTAESKEYQVCSDLLLQGTAEPACALGQQGLQTEAVQSKSVVCLPASQQDSRSALPAGP